MQPQNTNTHARSGFRSTIMGVLLLAVSILVAGCFPTRYIKDDERLLIKSHIKIDNAKVDKDDLYSYLKQQPNRKILGLVRFHLGAYNVGSRGKDRKYKRWLRNTVGEEPVIYDPALTEKSRRQLEIYLHNKGYFNAVVTDSVKLYNKSDSTSKKKAAVTYHIKTGQPYKIRKIRFHIEDTTLTDGIRLLAKDTKLTPGDNYDTDVLTEERARVTKALKNQGYWNFKKEYLFFKIDSSLNMHRVDVTVNLKNRTEIQPRANGPDSVVERNHEKYYVKNIYVHPNYNSKNPTSGTEDTLQSGSLTIYSEGLQLRPAVLANAVKIKRDSLYNQSDVENTQSQLASLGVYKFISIVFEEAGVENGNNVLDCKINLSPAPQKSITVSTEGTNRAGNLGVSANVILKNKNTFRGAEMLEVRFSGGLEAQRTQVTDENVSDNLQALPFNTLEFGPEVRLYIPRLLMPVWAANWLGGQDRKTSTRLSYSYQQRPDFSRRVAAATFGWHWKGGVESFFTHNWDVADINFVNINMDPEFAAILENSGNVLLQNSYNDHLIVAMRYTLDFLNKRQNSNRNFRHLRTSIEGAGNALRWTDNIVGRTPNAEGNYELFGVQYAQYLRLEADYSYFDRINKWSWMVYRTFVGLGRPGKNLNALPFEKSFFVGGANGLRAWRARTLGPGSAVDTSLTVIDQIGDIQLEANMEYRFDLFSALKGAAFLDVGNVWLWGNDPNRVGGHFDLTRFYREFAVGPGLGIRFDFDYFIVRLDAGYQAKNPQLPEGERWFWQPKDEYNALKRTVDPTYSGYRSRVTLNLGIGYPFQ